jgi:hypothetical protein
VNQWDSRIVGNFPLLFEEFRAKRFNLLWRDSSDCFTAQKFYCNCDDRANTLVLTRKTYRNIFGSCILVEWESGDKWKSDDRLRCSLFTLKNPHSLPPR